jgi:hypothetical protein
MKDFIARLSSRKFLITIALLVALTLFPDLPDGVVQLALAYLGIEGLTDVVSAYKRGNVDTAKVEKDIALINQGEIPAGSAGSNTIVPGK